MKYPKPILMMPIADGGGGPTPPGLATEATLNQVNSSVATVAEDEGLRLLRRIFQLLKPLGVVTGGQSNRLNVDVTTVTGVTTVGTVSNQTNMGGVTAFELMKATSRTAFNTGLRANIT